MPKVVMLFRKPAVAWAVTDADQTRADATVQMVVATLGAGLGELSNRDLVDTFRRMVSVETRENGGSLSLLPDSSVAL